MTKKMPLAMERRYATEFRGSRHEEVFVRAIAHDDVETARKLVMNAPFARQGIRALLDDTAFIDTCSASMYAALWESYLADIQGRWSEHGVVISIWAATQTPASADQIAALVPVIERSCTGQALLDATTYLWEAPHVDGRVLLNLPVKTVIEIVNQSARRGNDAEEAMDAWFGQGFFQCLRTASAHNTLNWTLRDFAEFVKPASHAFSLLSRLIGENRREHISAAVAAIASLPDGGAAVAQQMALSGTEMTSEELLDLASCIEHPADQTHGQAE